MSSPGMALGTGALLAALCVPVALAQQYPIKPIRILVGFAPGGPSDVGARTIGQKLTEKWGQPVIVDFRPGAAGNIATDMAAKAPPDGYTLIAAAFAHAVNPSLYARLPFNAEKDFAPVLLFASVPNLLVVHPSLPARSVKALLAPAGTPREIVTRLNTEVASAIREPDARARFNSIGSEPMSSTPEGFAAFIRSEMVKWAKVVKAAGICVE